MNKLIVEVTTCMSCPKNLMGYYFPTSDSYDFDYVGYCKHEEAPSSDPRENKVGYGEYPEEFPIPNWCPLLKQ